MPFPYYNTSAPTPSTKNNINDIAVTYGIRDFLLNKNLLPIYPSISTSLNGSPRIGEPVLDTSINSNANTIPFGLPLETEGLLRYDTAILQNRFKNTDPNSPSLLTVDNITTTQGPFGNTQFPQGIESYPSSSNEDVFNYGLMGKTVTANYRKDATLRNLYLSTDSQVDTADWISLQPSGFNQQINGYLDTYGTLNIGDGGSIQASNVIGSILNGQGLGVSQGGVVPNFDIRATLAGRVLGATGLINDTKLGLIGGQQLALALANNAAFNVEQDILGALNVQDNLLSLVKNGTLAGFRPNYKITVPSSNGGRVADYTARILGFTLPKSYLNDAGSIFLTESDSSNIERANSMILNTGKGQVTALIANMFANINGTTVHDNPETSHFRSGYAPGFKNNKGEKAINPNVYAFSDADGIIYNFITTGLGPIPEISYNRSAMIDKYGFKDSSSQFLESFSESNIKTPTFSWGTNLGGNVNSTPDYQPFVGDRKTLLAKTQLLFNTNGMLNIVTAKGDMSVSEASQIQTAVVGLGISKGSAVMSKNSFSEDGHWGSVFKTADETYCRSWTTKDRYDQVSKLVRNKGLDEVYPYRHQFYGESVLDDNGFVKVSPYSTDAVDDPKKYMLSLENLAWFDKVNDLIPCEQGPGDLISGKRGRIMWFPPYNIQFSETSTPNWESNNFIGRGEPVYTYNNTERGGNLSFQIIVDHPSYVNSFKGSNGPDDHYVASFFAGCVDPSQRFVDKLTVSEISEIVSKNITQTQTQTLVPETPPDAFDFYYANDSFDMNIIFTDGYESGLSGSTPSDKIDYDVYTSGFSIGSFVGGVTSQSSWTDNENYGLNGWKNPTTIDGTSYSGITDPAYITALATYLDTKCPHCVVNVTSYASPQGNASYNEILADSRTESMVAYLKANLYSGKDNNYKNARIKARTNIALTSSESSCIVEGPVDTISCKTDRRTNVEFIFDNQLAASEIKAEPVIPQANNNVTVNTSITNRFYSECDYFEKLNQTDNFIFDKFREKIKYFHPAFHSTTPEGLNSRLTFLQQCTRQGPTLETQGANNLAFGRPPVCILRIGDFYNTKVIIDSLSIDYEPLVWDLNPEGVGVQPMIANITISFKFIGGSTLAGPINKLQNALSFNYYANTHVYDARADYIAKSNGSGYSIKNLINDDYDGNANAFAFGKVSDPNIISNNTPSLDQVASNDNTTSSDGSQTQAPSAGEEDIDRISLATAERLVNGDINLRFTIDGSTSLSKEADFRAYITDNLTNNELGIGTLNQVDLAQNLSFDVSALGLVDDKQYFISAKFGSIPKTISFNYTNTQ